ncbi:MAG: hypothetical protein ACKO5M_02070 [Vulcanococcus sp.]|nr:hypothetical protein [Cyanobacteriota bacterium]
MTTSIRSGRPHAGRASDALRFSTTAHTTPEQAPSRATPCPAPRPIHRDQPSWEELFGQR